MTIPMSIGIRGRRKRQRETAGGPGKSLNWVHLAFLALLIGFRVPFVRRIWRLRLHSQPMLLS
jgi:hypothetical protein